MRVTAWIGSFGRNDRSGQRGKAALAVGFGALAMVMVTAMSVASRTEAQSQGSYPKMAPVQQYMMERNDEIALARSAAPESISHDAEVMVMGNRGYETAVKGKNGFVCIVERGWTAGLDDPDFWNPKLRGPICFNAPAVRTYLPLTIKKTELILAGRSKEQMAEAIKAGLDKQELPALERGAMCYMLSKQGYLSEKDPQWHPHLMFFVPQAEAVTWGAGLPGSPMIAAKDDLDRMTVVMIPVGKWSDGTAGPAM